MSRRREEVARTPNAEVFTALKRALDRVAEITGGGEDRSDIRGRYDRQTHPTLRDALDDALEDRGEGEAVYAMWATRHSDLRMSEIVGFCIGSEDRFN